MSPTQRFELWTEWYRQDVDSFEAAIKPMPAVERAHLRDHLHRDYLRKTHKP